MKKIKNSNIEINETMNNDLLLYPNLKMKYWEKATVVAELKKENTLTEVIL